MPETQGFLKAPLISFCNINHLVITILRYCGTRGMVISITGAETAHMMALLGIHPDTWLVRITSPDFVDLKNMRIYGHFHTVAKIEDPYDLKTHPLISGLKLPRTKPSQNLGLECLNVMYTNCRISLHRAKMSVLGYRKSHRDIVICFQMQDVLSVGGKIYRDASSSLENVLILGLPAGASVPFRII